VFVFLSHYSATAATIEPYYIEQDVSSKPKGLWVSVDGAYDWPWWCRDENFEIESLRHRYVVTLSLEPRLAILGADDFAGFQATYGCHDFRGAPYSFYYVDWPRVAEDYNGILIPTYLWEYRLDDCYPWYYTWDCASGCIWHPDAIASVAIAPKQLEAPKSLIKI
jgi:hypothetical protein